MPASYARSADQEEVAITEPRIVPAEPPFEAKVQATLDHIMPPGMPIIQLFTTLARNPRLFNHFVGSGLGAAITLTPRQREVVVLRTTAQCGSEYEWGLHVYSFGEAFGFDEEQLSEIVHGDDTASCWTQEDRLMIRLCDSLNTTCSIDDALWRDLKAVLSDDQIMEAILVAGYYRTVAYLTNGLKLPLDDLGHRFPAA